MLIFSCLAYMMLVIVVTKGVLSLYKALLVAAFHGCYTHADEQTLHTHWRRKNSKTRLCCVYEL